MTYAQAKLAAVDHTIQDWRYLRAASPFLLARIAGTKEDVLDAADLANRAAKMQRAEIMEARV